MVQKIENGQISPLAVPTTKNSYLLRNCHSEANQRRFGHYTTVPLPQLSSSHTQTTFLTQTIILNNKMIDELSNFSTVTFFEKLMAFHEFGNS